MTEQNVDNEVRLKTILEVKEISEKLVTEFKSLAPDTKKSMLQEIQRKIKVTESELKNKK